MRWCVLVLLGLSAIAVSTSAVWLCSRGNEVVPYKPAAPRPKPPALSDVPVPGALKPSPIHLVEVTDSLGLNYVSFTGTTPNKLFPSANGTGVAMLDYDQDGWLDLYFASAQRLEPNSAEGPPNGLFRSRMAESFEEVTDPSGTAVRGFTQGLATGDFDNDGFPDLYLIRFGPDMLLHNNGDGTFSDLSACSGLNDPRWGTSAAFFDYDEDGNLDVYVANYGQWDLAWHDAHFCGQREPLARIYCSPKLLKPETHGLFRSHGDGTFSDVAAELGIARSDGRGQGVVACDLNNDGHVDLYVANDLSPNFLFLNSGQGRLQDCTEISCAAYNSDGKEEASMGVDAADVDGDGLPDLFVTNFFLEHNTLYRNLSSGQRVLFQDVSNWTGVAAGSIHSVGWGTAFEDFDGDGWLDIFVVNGHVDDNMARLGRNEPYAQKAGMWRNLGKGQFEMLPEESFPYLRSTHVSRGTAFGDLDNDGQVDVVISHKDERPTILRNDTRQHQQPANSWVQLTLRGTRSARDASGARVELELDGWRLTRHMRGGKSYLSGHDPRLTIGLGAAVKIDRLTVYWPSGLQTVLTDLECNRAHTIREPVR